MPPTMLDVARKAGVSPSTVSLAMNNKPGVSSETRDLILRIAAELGYEFAKEPSRQVTSAPITIAVAQYALRGEGHTASLTGLPLEYISGIRNYAREQDASLTVVANYLETDERHVGQPLLDAEAVDYDGLILIHCPSPHSRLIARAIETNRPVVAISRHWPDLPINTVGQDHRQQASISLEHLVSLGHRKIAFLGRNISEDYEWFGIRLDAYRRTMKRLDCWDERRVVIEPDSGQAALALMERCPDTTAIFAIGDEEASVAIKALCDAGISVPGQVSVVGMNNSCQPPEGYPSLTTVAFSGLLVGYLAAKTLVEHIRNQDLAYSRIFVRSWLIKRESTAPPRS